MVAGDAGVAGRVLVRQNRNGCTVFLISLPHSRIPTLVYRRRSDYYSMVVCFLFYLLLPVQYYFVYDGWCGCSAFYSGLRLF